MIIVLLLAAICAVQFILKIPYFKLPLDRDYGAHGYIAYSMLKRKGVLYRDLYESKTPGIKLMYMLAIKWFGISRKAFRLFFALYNTLTTIAVYALTARLSSPAAGLAAAAFYAVFSSMPSLWWHFSNTECYYVLPAVASFLCLAYGNAHDPALALLCIGLSGFFGAVTFMFKQPSLISTAAPAGLFLLLYAPHNRFVDIGLYSAGFVIPVIMFFTYFTLMKKTPWDKLPFSMKSMSTLKKYLTTPLFKVSRGTIESNRRRFRTIFYDIIFLFAFSLGGAIFLILSAPSQAIMVIPWIALSFFAAIISRTYLPYHFIPPVPPMCVMSGIVLSAAVATMGSPSHILVPADALTLGAAAALLLVTIYHLVKDLLLPPEMLGVFYSGEDQMYAVCEEVGKYIKSVTTEDDYVYSWGSEPEIYLWSERKAPVYCIYPPIVNPAVFTKDQVTAEFAQLLANKPKYFALTAQFGSFKEFEQIIVTHYELEKKFEPYLYLFKLRQQPQAA